ncbi:diguanylate cyclase (GGDEF) domain-containing protein [Pseudidiomarina planktonica]|uniref:diguanylate cyclase n=1 Tax=Pseudidiomarina planktonica TaxID=1323738 RepID=A0A1Y6G3B9_9GAMM|nr:GGDEF domain-containing protein [Pseudidiomarina planktonica]RUO63875.1 GGDEF domain-containing protein [Pseudidiomarina planktonica]SMQ80052.1 diguanylate cyclase (GGDEF) domain-containing protein [Pseudidiomarina planktonica]
MTQTIAMGFRTWQALLRSLTVAGLMLCAMLPVTAAMAQTTPVDETLEQALNNYLNDLQIEESVGREQLEAILAQVDETTPLSTRIRALSYLALVHQYDGDEAAAFAVNERMLAMTEGSGNADAEAEAIANRIELLQAQGKQAEAYLVVSDAEIALAQAQLPRVRFYVHNLISRIYADWGKYSDALEHLISALEAVNETNDDRTELRRQYLAYAIAQIQTDLAQWDDALETTTKAITDAQQFGLLENVPDLYLLKSYIEVSLENYSEADASMQLAMQWAERSDRPQIKLISLNNLGDLYIRTNDLDRAESYLNRALEQALALDDERTEQMVRFNLGFIDVKQGNTDSGLTLMREGLEYFRAAGRKSDLEQILGEIAEAYEVAGQYRQQAEALQEQQAISKELWQLEQQRNVTELQNLYDNKDKEQQIKILEQQNTLKQRVIEVNEQRQIIGLLLVIVVIFAGVFLWLMYRAARRANLRLKEANSQLAFQSLRDPLTGLWNRRALQQDMEKREQHGDRRQQDQQQTDGLILLDIDFFKRINDKHGHAAGDTVLIEISKRLQTICRETDKLIRWGGEEFLFYLRDVDNDRMKILTARILDVIAREPIMHEGKVIEVTTTAGFICLPFAGVDETLMDWEKVLQLADMALYTGKAHGRNRGVGITELHVPYNEAREVLETDLSAALEKGWVTMVTIEGQDSG